MHKKFFKKFGQVQKKVKVDGDANFHCFVVQIKISRQTAYYIIGVKFFEIINKNKENNFYYFPLNFPFHFKNFIKEKIRRYRETAFYRFFMTETKIFKEMQTCSSPFPRPSSSTN